MEENNEMQKQYEAKLKEALNYIKALQDELQRANMFNAFKRLDYLFKVLESHNLFPKEFVQNCIDEIQLILNPEEDEADNKEENQKEEE